MKEQIHNTPLLRFPEFKDEWKWNTLGRVFEITSSKRVFESEWTTKGIPFYRAREIVKLNETGAVDNELFISEEMYEDYRSKYGVPKIGDLLVTGVGTIGRIFRVTTDEPFYFKDGNIIWLRSLDKVDSRFIEQLFQSRVIQNQIKANASITTVGTYTIDSAKKTKFPETSLPEQQKIAMFLSEVAEKIAQLSRKKELLIKYKKGVMQQIFSQKIRFKDNRGNEFPKWGERKIGSIAEVTAGATPSSLKSEYWDGDIRWMNSGELNLKRIFEVENRITELGLKKTSTQILPIGSVLIGLAGQGKTRGTVAMNMVELCTNQSIAAIHPNKTFYVGDFLYHNLDFRYDELRRLSTGDGGRGGLNLQIIRSLRVPLPSIVEQQKIADLFTVIDNKIDLAKKQLEKTKTFKKGLLQQMFV